MAKYVLAADYTLMTDYRNVPLATFFSCIPTDYWQSRLVFRILADQPKLDAAGRPIRVPYGLRKVEASLVRAFGRDDVVIADPRDVDRYIDDETEVVGLHSMDPLGLGPVSMSFTMGGVLTPYTKAMFLDLVQRVQRPNRKYKIVLGGPGAWHFDYRQEMQESLGIDHIVHGEVDHLVPEIFDRIVNDHAPPVMRFTNATAPTVDQIPKILGPTMHAMNEVMRGCGRGCEFCEVTLRRPRYFPFDYIGDEIAMNTKVGESSIQLHSDDIFLYNLENWKTMEPNEDAVKDLFRYVMAQPGVSHCYPTHGTVSAAVTNPGLIRDISDIVRAGPRKWVGIQSGIETGSPALSRAVLHRKAAPFSAEEWPDLVVQGTQILNRNYWYPAFTIILGLPGETPEDAWMTVDLLDRMEQIPDSHFITAPLTFVPIGVLRGEEFYNLDEMIGESRGNGLAPDLNEIHRPIEHDRRIVADCDVQGESGLIATREARHRGLEQRPTKPATAAILRHPELRDERHAHPMRDQDCTHDPVALECDLRGVRHELTGIAFEEAGHVAAPFLLRPRVDAILLLHVSFVHIHEELREAKDFVLLRRLQHHAGGHDSPLRRSFHPHARKDTLEAERRECGFVDVLEVRRD